MLPTPALIDLKYSWDDGLWRVTVSGFGGMLAAWKAFDTEEEAQKGITDLRHRLAEAPDGNVRLVILDWADWVHPGRLYDDRRSG